MEATYLKREVKYSFTDEIVTQSTVKVINNRALHCYNNSIEIDGLDGEDTNSYFINFYEGLDYIPATKEEFDLMYIKAVKEVNELSKI